MPRHETDICDECGQETIARYMEARLCPECRERVVECVNCEQDFRLGEMELTFAGRMCAECYKKIGAEVEYVGAISK